MRATAFVHVVGVLVSLLFLSACGEAAVIGWWSFDDASQGVALDESGNDNHFDLGGAGFSKVGEGIAGRALVFAQDTDRPIARSTTGLRVTTSFSIELWIKPTSAISSYPVNRFVTYDGERYVFRIEGGELHGYVWEEGQGWPVSLHHVYGLTEVPTDVWSHVAFTYDGSELKLYLNGELDNSAPCTCSIDQGGDNDLSLSNGPAEPFLGLMDEVHIFDTALQQLELGFFAGVYAYAGSDQTIFSEETVTLDGRGSRQAESYSWEQVILAGEPEVTLEETGTPGVVEFTAPTVTVGTVLTFQLTVSGAGVTDTDTMRVFVRARNRPMVAPSNLISLRVHEGFVLIWDVVIDADTYAVEFQVGPAWFPIQSVDQPANMQPPTCTLSDIPVGQPCYVRVVARNSYGESDPSEVLECVPMRNLALAGGLTHPASYVFAVSRLNVRSMNNATYGEHNDSDGGEFKSEDFWGYLWDEPLYFEHIAYFTGEMPYDGGWFTDLNVQYTEDGSQWIDLPYVDISPAYDFTDSPMGRGDFARYDIAFPIVRGKGIRIHGTPGGLSTFTSMAELEVYGDQGRSPLVVQGLDDEAMEGTPAVLDGSHSFSTRGPIVSYEWEQVGGPPVTIQNATGEIASFDATQVEEDTLLLFRLTASDGTETSTDEEVRVTVKNITAADRIGPDQATYEGVEVTLGVEMASPWHTCHWSQVAGPPVTLNNPDGCVCTFTAPGIWSLIERLTFQLEVEDTLGGPTSDEVNVDVISSAFDIHPVGHGYLKDLLHLGQTPEDRFLSPLDESLDTNDYLAKWGGQANVNPVEGEEYDFAGTGVTTTSNPMIWTPIHSQDGFFGNESLDRFGQMYHVYILSPEKKEARLRFRSDDELRIWNNGVLAVARDGWDGGTEQYENLILDKGINSVTLRFEESTGGNHIAVRVTDRADVPCTDLFYSLSLPNPLPAAYAVRNLPDSYRAGEIVDVQLLVRADPENLPSTVQITEAIPEGLTVVDAGGGQVTENEITWLLTGDQASVLSISYLFGVPEGSTIPLDFQGTVDYPGGDPGQTVFGDSVLYAAPAPPKNLRVEMVLAAHLSWDPCVGESVVGYRVYRSENGGEWEQIASVTEAWYTDEAVVPGGAYQYLVTAVNKAGREGPPSQPTEVKELTGQIREAEEFNYGGGQWPPYQNCPDAVEAPCEECLDASYDFWHPNKGEPGEDFGYRKGVPTRKVGDTVCISWIDPGSWWRYGFDVPRGGWIKLAFRASSPEGGTLAAYWDEELIGITPFVTGDRDTFQSILLEDQIETAPGAHVLRVQLIEGQMDFDTIAVGFNWAAPTGEVFFEDDFEEHTALYDTISADWTVINGSGVSDGAWRLWNTAGEFLGVEDPAIAAMTNNYAITDSDLAGEVDADEELITPKIDCTNYKRVRVEFSMNYRAYPDDTQHLQVAEVDIRSSDDGVIWGNWVNLRRWDTSIVGVTASGRERVDLSAHADGAFIQLRWRFHEANYDYWFAVDDIRVSGEPEPPSHDFHMLWYANGVVDYSWAEFGGGNYTVQYTDDLTSRNWWPVPGHTWPITWTSWSGDITSIFDKAVYLRVRSE